MARGWESKSVEEQQAMGNEAHTAGRSEAARQGLLDRAERERQRQALELQRERILSERTSSAHRRAALEAALSDVESRISALSK